MATSDRLDRKYKRKKLFVDERQRRMIAMGVGYFLTIVITFAVAIFLPLIIEMNSDTTSSFQVQEAAKEFLVLHNRVWAPLLLVLVLLVLHTVVVSHRIAGPLYRFRNFLRIVGEGDISRPMTIRAKDYMTKEAEVINEMIRLLKDRVDRIKEQHEDTSAVVTELQESIERGSMDDVRRQAEQLSVLMERMQKCTDAFKTEKDPPSGRQETPRNDDAKLVAEPVGHE